MPTADYFQPDVDKYAIGGFSFLRLRQYLASSGDIFESGQGCHAIGLGPDSDIANVNVTYLDPQIANTLLQQMTISPQRSWASELYALADQQYMPAGVPGKILLSPADLFDEEFLPTGFNPANDKLVFELPLIDIVQYFQPPPALSGLRSDKTYIYSTLPFGVDDVWVLLPYYGRSYASVEIQNTGAAACDVTIRGVNFLISETVPAELELVAAFTIAAGAAAKQQVRAATMGRYDYLMLYFNPAAATDCAVRVTVSDTPT